MLGGGLSSKPKPLMHQLHRYDLSLGLLGVDESLTQRRAPFPGPPDRDIEAYDPFIARSARDTCVALSILSHDDGTVISIVVDAGIFAMRRTEEIGGIVGNVGDVALLPSEGIQRINGILGAEPDRAGPSDHRDA